MRSTVASECERFVRLLEIWRIWHRELPEPLFGFGSGRYGLQSFGAPDAEKHSPVIDRILASGVLESRPASMSLLLAWVGTKRLNGRGKWLVRPSIARFGMMGARESSPTYLFRAPCAGVAGSNPVSLPTMASALRTVQREMPR